MTCPVCGGSERSLVYRVDNNHRRELRTVVSIARCMSCRTAFLDDHSREFQGDLYEYYDKYSGRPIEELVSPLTLASYARVLRRASRLTTVRTILDVGCGKGEFLWAAQRQGYKAVGLELADQAVAIAQDLGLPAKKKSLLSEELDGSSWDLITMFEVIEHVDAPSAMIQRAAHLLNPGGVLYMTTPNFNSLDRLFLGSKWKVFHPEHITYFSSRGLARLVRQCAPSLQLISVQSNNISPSLLLYLIRIAGLFAGGRRNKDSPGEQDKAVDLRALSEGSGASRFLKRGVNHILSAAGIGSTTILIAKKRQSG
jgi:2-polyprenyl-3-methyl-5-hydroxy-6-metoxy-1,4-benzoquinol methylase